MTQSHEDMMRERHKAIEDWKEAENKKIIADAEPYLDQIEQLKELYINAKVKEGIYEGDYDNWKAVFRGHKAGGLRKSYNIAFSKFVDKLEKFGFDYNQNDKKFHIVTQYLQLVCKDEIERRLAEKGYVDNR